MSDSTMSPWAVRAVAFDLDGLMVDSEPLFEETARRLLARRGRELAPEVARAMMGTPARQALELFRTHYRLADSVAELNAESITLFLDLLGDRPMPLLPGVLDLLDRLERQGIPRGIATSSSLAYVNRVLQPHQVLQRFAFVLTCDDVTMGKPFPEVYQKAAGRFGVAPHEMLVLEDSANGLRAAKAAGARCVVVPHGLVDPTDLAGADAVVSNLASPDLYHFLGL